jgi:hypothetical protein
VVRPSGSQVPVDLIAWKQEGDILIIQVKRARSPVGNAFRVAKEYHCDLQAFRAIKRPHFARTQLWLWTGCNGWRYFLVLTGGICEVSDYVA